MFRRIILSLILISMIFSGLAYYVYNKQIKTPIGQEHSFIVEKGQSFHKVLNELQETLQLPAYVGKIHLKLNSMESALKPGRYVLSPEMTFEETLEILSVGQVIEYKVTIPEGYNVFEIADLLVKKEIINDKEDFLNLALNRCEDFLNPSDCLNTSLEGFLFPETYMFQKDIDAAIVIKTLVNHHLKKKNALLKNFIIPTNLKSWFEVVTLASVIEKETGAPTERPLISSVFHNRLTKKMRLQSDPTTIYGRWVVDKKRLFNIRKKHLIEKTPYNTYAVPRLPVGPIANPGLKAIKAALKPEVSGYLYFVSKNDGTHKFSKSYKEHQKAVQDFQISRKARKGKSWRDLKK